MVEREALVDRRVRRREAGERMTREGAPKHGANPAVAPVAGGEDKRAPTAVAMGEGIVMALYSGASGPFAGMIIVAICLPWTNTKGTAIATSAAFAFELWQTVGRTLSGLEPPRMNTTLLHCANNATALCSSEGLAYASQPVPGTANLTCGRTGMPEVRGEDVFFLYRLSSYWSSFFAMLATVALSLVLSIFLGHKDELRKSMPLSSPAFLRLWARLRLLPDETKRPGAEAIVKSEDVCESEEEVVTMIAVTKLPGGHHLREDGI
ncbi:hypothetical protein HPB51_016401 [Rhipicephalus microplus]|uniref:Uncharacterized protein n=1 Tax=Rhipicephalus microplus TaxID=6941 RepID=A0A9J6EAL3_RHIMP|nr:hypothetical protein HPB51_016401 [Rhipicephalus microplus]